MLNKKHIFKDKVVCFLSLMERGTLVRIIPFSCAFKMPSQNTHDPTWRFRQSTWKNIECFHYLAVFIIVISTIYISQKKRRIIYKEIILESSLHEEEEILTNQETVKSN